MDDISIEYRIIAEAQFIIENKATVRQTAAKFSISKSAVHKDVSYKLKYLDERLYKECKNVLQANLKERHLRGGNATKRKFEILKEIAAGKNG